MRTHRKGARKHFEHDIRCGARGYVEVGGLATEEQVAYASTGEISFVAGVAQLGEDAKSGCELGRGGRHGRCSYCRAPGRERCTAPPVN